MFWRTLWNPISQHVSTETLAAQVLIGFTSSTSIVVFSINKVWIARLAAVVAPQKSSPTMLPLYVASWIVHLATTVAKKATTQAFAVTEFASSMLRPFAVVAQLVPIGAAIAAEYPVSRVGSHYLATWFLSLDN